LVEEARQLEDSKAKMFSLEARVVAGTVALRKIRMRLYRSIPETFSREKILKIRC
jgi:hypothetical protein